MQAQVTSLSAVELRTERLDVPSLVRTYDRLTLFVFLWSAYLFVHQCTIYFSWLQFSDLHKLVFDAGLTLLAIFCVSNPKSVRSFAY